MRVLALMCGAAALAGCARMEDQKAVAADTAATVDPAAAPKALTVSDVTGTWNVRALNERGDSTLVAYSVTAAADTGEWMLTLPNRAPMKLQLVALAGDSMTVAAGPYESVLRPGVMVRIRSTLRLLDGALVGSTRASYAGAGGDSVRVLRTEGYRAP